MVSNDVLVLFKVISWRWCMRIIMGFILLLVFSVVLFAAELTIGLIPEQNVFKQMRRYKPMGEYIEKKSGIKIKFTILSQYGNMSVITCLYMI